MAGYEQANREVWRTTDGRLGMKVVLPRGEVFWSRGWRGCPGCGGDAKGPADLKPVYERRAGMVRVGWNCAGR